MRCTAVERSLLFPTQSLFFQWLYLVGMFSPHDKKTPKNKSLPMQRVAAA